MQEITDELKRRLQEDDQRFRLGSMPAGPELVCYQALYMAALDPEFEHLPDFGPIIWRIAFDHGWVEFYESDAPGWLLMRSRVTRDGSMNGKEVWFEVPERFISMRLSRYVPAPRTTMPSAQELRLKQPLTRRDPEEVSLTTRRASPLDPLLSPPSRPVNQQPERQSCSKSTQPKGPDAHFNLLLRRTQHAAHVD